MLQHKKSLIYYSVLHITAMYYLLVKFKMAYGLFRNDVPEDPSDVQQFHLGNNHFDSDRFVKAAETISVCSYEMYCFVGNEDLFPHILQATISAMYSSKVPLTTRSSSLHCYYDLEF